MSLINLIQDARAEGRHDDDGWLVIFDGEGRPNMVDLRVKREFSGVWHAICKDGSGTCVSLHGRPGRPIEQAVEASLDNYLLIVNYGLGSAEYEAGVQDRIERELRSELAGV